LEWIRKLRPTYEREEKRSPRNVIVLVNAGEVRVEENDETDLRAVRTEELPKK